MGTINPHPRIGKHTFLLVQWLMWSLTTCALAFRLYIRGTTFGRLQNDDYLVIGAWAIYLSRNIIWHTQIDTVYALAAFFGGKIPSDILKFIDQVLEFVKMFFVLDLLFYCSLYSVKLSFLLFLRRLGDRVRSQKIWWWVVLALNLAAWVASVGNYQWDCSFGSTLHIIAYCNSAESERVEARAFYINASLDLFTDALIITIPVLILRKVRITLKKKIVLLAILSLTVLTMTFGLIRMLVTHGGSIVADQSWTCTWSHVELGVAILVTCLGSFRQLYTRSSPSNREPHSGYETSRQSHFVTAISERLERTLSRIYLKQSASSSNDSSGGGSQSTWSSYHQSEKIDLDKDDPFTHAKAGITTYAIPISHSHIADSEPLTIPSVPGASYHPSNMANHANRAITTVKFHT